MSTAQSNPPAPLKSVDEFQLPPLEKAAEAVKTAYNRVFFHKLASLGVQPADEQEAIALLDTAALLRNHPQIKQAKAQRQSAVFGLREKLAAQLGIDVTRANNEQTKQAEANQYAALLTQDPAFFLSSLAVQADASPSAN